MSVRSHTLHLWQTEIRKKRQSRKMAGRKGLQLIFILFIFLKKKTNTSSFGYFMDTILIIQSFYTYFHIHAANGYKDTTVGKWHHCHFVLFWKLSTCKPAMTSRVKKKKYTREKFKKRKKRRNRNIIEGTEFGKEAMCRAKVI